MCNCDGSTATAGATFRHGNTWKQRISRFSPIVHQRRIKLTEDLTTLHRARLGFRPVICEAEGLQGTKTAGVVVGSVIGQDFTGVGRHRGIFNLNWMKMVLKNFEE